MTIDFKTIVVEGKVIGKWISGIIFKTPMLSVDLVNNEFKDKYIDIPVSMAVYHAVEKGTLLDITFENYEGNYWRIKKGTEK